MQKKTICFTNLECSQENFWSEVKSLTLGERLFDTKKRVVFFGKTTKFVRFLRKLETVFCLPNHHQIFAFATCGDN